MSRPLGRAGTNVDGLLLIVRLIGLAMSVWMSGKRIFGRPCVFGVGGLRKKMIGADTELHLI